MNHPVAVPRLPVDGRWPQPHLQRRHGRHRRARVGLAKGTDLALFEASWYDEDENPPGVHLTAGECGDHAARAGVERLLLTHITPWGDRQRTYEQARRHFTGDLDVATRGVVYDI